MFSKWCMQGWGMAFAATIALVLAGCGSTGGGDGGGSNGSGGTDTGTLRLSVTDAAVDEADEVNVYFTGIEIQSQSGERMTFALDTSLLPSPRRINLLELQGLESERLLEVEVPAGLYSWIRLILDQDNPGDIVINGTKNPLRIPSGSQTGLKLNRGFTVAAGNLSDFTIEFDLRKSVHYPPGLGGDYMLRPTLRLVDNLAIGSIAGTVDPSLLGESPCAAVMYVFAGLDVEPDDIDGLEPEPITSAMVDINTLTYVVGFLAPGEYTVALTCNAADDDPEQDNSLTNAPLTFISTASVTVTAETESMLDFAPLPLTTAVPLEPGAPLPPPLPPAF